MDASFDELEFLVGWCPTCRHEVLAYADPDVARADPACVLCDGRGLQQLRPVTGRELPEKGYALWHDGGCGRSGCGSGGCGRR